MRSFLPIIFLILAGIVFFYFTDPVLSQIKELRATKQELNSGLENAGKLADRQEELRRRKNAITEEQLDRLNKLIPDHVDNVRLIIEMLRVGVRAGMPLSSLVVDVGSGGEGEGVKSENAAAKNSLNEVEISFNVSGSYQLFKSFLANLADNLRILDVTGFSVSATVPDLYHYTVKLKTYWLSK